MKNSPKMSMEFHFETGKQLDLDYRIMQQAERDKICRYCLDNASLFDLVNEGIIVPESVRTKWDFEKLIRGCLGEGQFKCPISDCEQCFETAAELRGHTRVHISAKVLVCKICRKRFVGFCILYPEPEVAQKNVQVNDEQNVQQSVQPNVEQSVQQHVEQNDQKAIEETVQQDDEQNAEESVQPNVEENVEQGEDQNVEQSIQQNDDQIEEQQEGDDNWAAEPIVEQQNT